LVFSSPIGVRTFFEQLDALEMDMRSLMQSGTALKIAAIGSATAGELKKYGLCADVTPKVYNAKYLGEAIAKEAAPDSEIIIVRAKEGSKELIPPLEAAGLSVKDIATYETIYEVNEVLCESVADAFAKGEIDAVTFTSASTVKGFVKGLKDLDYTGIKAVCIGEQTAAEARKYGMDIVISKEASMDSMMELIIEEFGQ
ncbi:MAG: uroporphyrinogen-III synthase, partial [Lachnospiraceae bacterium]|nr:uroporphyrinogen-III synthase [Lachnospiraceae bacterium]